MFNLSKITLKPDSALLGGFRKYLFQTTGLFFSILGGIVLLYKIPYGFETNDQFQYFILPYRSIYTPFLVGDWFTWETSHYHVTFSWVIRLLHALFGKSGFPVAIFVLHYFVLCGIAYSLYRLAKAIDGGIVSAVVGLLVIAFVRQMGVAETIINHGVLLPSDMALPFFLIAISYWVEKKTVKTGLFLGLSGFIHANYAVLGPLVVGGPELIDLIRSRDYRSTLKMALTYMVVASPTIVGTLIAFLSSDSAPEALRILFTVRSPHHYSPIFTNSKDLVFMGVVALVGLPHFLSSARGGYRHSMIWVALAASQLVAVFATEMQQATLIRLFFWRMSLSFILLGILGVGATIDRAIRNRDWASLLFGLSGSIILASFSANGQIQFVPRLEISGHGWMLASLVILMLYIPFEKTKCDYFKSFRYVFSVFPVGYAVLLSSGIGLASHQDSIRWDTALKKWNRFYKVDSDTIFGNKKHNPVFDWIARKTPTKASFLIPPGTNEFRFEAQRAAFVDWKCCPMKGEEIEEWKRRMLAVMGTMRFPATGYSLHRVSNRMYHSRSLNALAALARKEGISHILAKKESGYQSAGLKKLKKKAGWTVFKVLPLNGADAEQH